MPSSEIMRTQSCENNSDDSSLASNDYNDRHVVPIRLSTFTETQNPDTGEKFTNFNITLANKPLTSKRYKEFDSLHSLLKREFLDFNFPNFPKKWPFRLGEQQIESRRKSLEIYLEQICSVRVIYDSEFVRDFLNLPENNNSSQILVKEPLNNKQQKKYVYFR